MITLPTIPPDAITEYVTTIPYTAISTPATAFRVLIVGLPDQYVVCGTCIRLLTSFDGTSLNSLTCSLGAFVPNSILTDITYYGTEFELTQVVTPESYSLSGPPGNNLNLGPTQAFAAATALYFNGAHDVSAYFTSQGTTLNNLTVGAVEITVQIRPL